jgi:hypothetical protein
MATSPGSIEKLTSLRSALPLLSFRLMPIAFSSIPLGAGLLVRAILGYRKVLSISCLVSVCKSESALAFLSRRLALEDES